MNSHTTNKRPRRHDKYGKIPAIHETNGKKRYPANPNKKVDTK